MTKNSWGVAGLVGAALATIVACSSSSGSSNGPGSANECSYNLAAELQVASGAGSTCASCIQSSCSSQVSTYEGSGGCGAYFSCICPGGTATTNQSTIESCASQQSSACSSAAEAFSSCAQTNCATPCKTSTGGGSGGGSGSGSGSGSGGGSAEDAAAFDATCTKAYNCCLAVEGGSNPSSGVMAACQSTIESFQNGDPDLSCSVYSNALADAGGAACQ